MKLSIICQAFVSDPTRPFRRRHFQYPDQPEPANPASLFALKCRIISLSATLILARSFQGAGWSEYMKSRALAERLFVTSL
jgi:hypothetical protein